MIKNQILIQGIIPEHFAVKKLSPKKEDRQNHPKKKKYIQTYQYRSFEIVLQLHCDNFTQFFCLKYSSDDENFGNSIFPKNTINPKSDSHEYYH